MIETIKKLSIGLGVAVLMVSCSKDMEDVNPSSTLGGVSVDAAKAKSITNYAFSNLRTSDGMTWSFDVQRSGDQTGANGNTVVLGLFGCDGEPIMLSEANVTSLSISGANGTQELALAFADDSNNACSMAATPNYVSFSNFEANLKTNTVYTFTLTLNSATMVTSANAGVRAGNVCFSDSMEGPGCDEMDICGEGHGAFHKEGSWKGHTVTLGGETYTEAQGIALLNPNAGGGNKYARFAFSQGATVILNRAMGEISATAYESELAAINAYLATLGRLTTSNAGTEYDESDLAQSAKRAAGYIGDKIQCNED